MSTWKLNKLETVSGSKSILVEDLANIFADYVDNAAAIAGGLAVGKLYYNTTDSKVTKVV